MSPEQLRDTSRVDQRADLWAVSVILFELLTGKRPFDGPSPPDVVVNILSKPAPPPSSAMSPCPPGLDAFFARAFAADPAQRFASASRDGGGDGGVRAQLRRRPRPGRPSRSDRRHARLFGLVTRWRCRAQRRALSRSSTRRLQEVSRRPRCGASTTRSSRRTRLLPPCPRRRRRRERSSRPRRGSASGSSDSRPRAASSPSRSRSSRRGAIPRLHRRSRRITPFPPPRTGTAPTRTTPSASARARSSSIAPASPRRTAAPIACATR